MRTHLFLTLLCAGLAGCGDSTTTDGAVVHDMKMPTQPDLTMMQGQPDLVMMNNADMTGIVEDMAGASNPMLTVKNTLSWCKVIVTINGNATTFQTSSMTFTPAANTTVMLQADPLPTFLPVKWTGVTTMNGDMATYDVTAAPSQTVTACCPLSDGSGC
jgi:hypothetical protein